MLHWEEPHKYLDGAVPQQTAVSRLGKHFRIIQGLTVLLTVEHKEWAPMQCGEASESLSSGNDSASVSITITDM